MTDYAQKTLDALERVGFVYCVPTDDAEEVKLV